MLASRFRAQTRKDSPSQDEYQSAYDACRASRSFPALTPCVSFHHSLDFSLVGWLSAACTWQACFCDSTLPPFLFLLLGRFFHVVNLLAFEPWPRSRLRGPLSPLRVREHLTLYLSFIPDAPHSAFLSSPSFVSPSKLSFSD